MGELKQIKRDPLRFDLFEAYLHATEGRSLREPGAIEDFIAKGRESVTRSLNNEAFLHGQRVENLFESVVVSLGHVRLIKSEDAGSGWHSEDALVVPDFRVVMEDGEQFLVEVKNFHASAILKPYSLNATYVESLRRYGDLVGNAVRLAVYWSHINVWTVVPIDVMERTGDKYLLSLLVAMRSNTMSSFGDMMVGTTPPLELHLIANPNEPRSFDGQQALMTTGHIKLFCAGREVTNKKEFGIAVSLMMFGDWDEQEPRLECDDDGLPLRIVYECLPSGDSKQGFEIVGHLSGMYSRRFALLTMDEGRVERLATEINPGVWGSLIPEGYKGDALPLWCMKILPPSGSPGQNR